MNAGDSEVQVVLVVAPGANALFSLFELLPVIMRLCGSSAAVLALLVGEVEVLVLVVVFALALLPNIELNIAVGSDTGAPRGWSTPELQVGGDMYVCMYICMQVCCRMVWYFRGK